MNGMSAGLHTRDRHSPVKERAIGLDRLQMGNPWDALEQLGLAIFNDERPHGRKSMERSKLWNSPSGEGVQGLPLYASSPHSGNRRR
jgi:hypothetical protein